MVFRARRLLGSVARGLVAPVLVTFVTFALLVPMAAFAQGTADAFPSKPLRLVVNFAPGGTVDIIGRILAQKLSESFGQPVVVENRAGANGNIGAEMVAKSRPDGYTVLMTSTAVLKTNPHIYRSMPFDTLRDFALITEVARTHLLLVIKPSLPVNSARELLDYLRSHPGKLSYGSAGNGSGPHIAAEMLIRQTGGAAVHVPYKGLGPALSDLLAGQIDFMFDSGGGVAQIRSGKVKLLAVGSTMRYGLFPDAPTLIEAGLPGFNTESSHGLVAPAGTPAETIGRLHQESVRILRRPEVSERILAAGCEVIGNSPAEFAANLRSEYQRIGRFIQESGIRGE